MNLNFDRLQLARPFHSLYWVISLLLLMVALHPGALFAASQPALIAIELFDGPNGPAYVQLSEVLINGKITLRDCSPFQSGEVDKSTYGRMQKITLTPRAILERDQDGVLHYLMGSGAAACVLPDNLKFEHSGSYTLASLVDLGRLTGTQLTSSSAGITSPSNLPNGSKLYLMTAPDQELAEFLRAERANDMEGWSSYLSKYPTSSHAQDARASLGELYVSAGETALSRYLKSVAEHSPNYGDLKQASAQFEKVQSLQLPAEKTSKLAGELRKESSALVERGNSELTAYNAALQAHTVGYIHLKNARSYADAISMVDLNFAPGRALLAEVLNASNLFDRTLRSAESAVTARNMDGAIEIVAPIRSFSSEEPRINAVVGGIYAGYLEEANELTKKLDWKRVVLLIEKAIAIKETPEARALLTEAQKQQAEVVNKMAAAKALETSKELEQQHNNIDALEVLYNLPPAQKALVVGDLERLKIGYAQSAVQAARDLQKAHEPIRGLGDEIGIEKAYIYLLRAFEFTGSDSYRDMSEILGDELSTYFVSQAKLYLDKPSGSGTELGWSYLEKALLYQPSNQAAHDMKVVAAPAHAMHAGLSIRVQFRDQTSLRDSTGFLHQLEDAIAAGLETPNVKIVRNGEGPNGIEPDFQLAGDVLEHQISDTVTVDAKESRYRIGTHEVTGDEWNAANRAYEQVLRTLQTDQSALIGAQSKGNKKDIKELNAKIEADQKLVTEAQARADSFPKTVTSDVIRPYHYTVKTVDIKNTIRLQFRVGETLNSKMSDAITVSKEDPRHFVLTEDVKPDDTEGVKPNGTSPNMRELQTALENSVRDVLVEAVRSKVKDLPALIYSEARSKEQNDNADGAAEYYLRFLGCTREDGSIESQHAKSFLAGTYNIRLDEMRPR